MILSEVHADNSVGKVCMSPFYTVLLKMIKVSHCRSRCGRNMSAFIVYTYSKKSQYAWNESKLPQDTKLPQKDRKGQQRHKQKRLKIHPSIYFLYSLNQGGWSLSQRSSGERQVHPGQVPSPSQGHIKTNNHTHAHTHS